MRLIMNYAEAKELDKLLKTQSSELTVLKSMDTAKFSVELSSSWVTVEADDDAVIQLLKDFGSVGKSFKCMNIIGAIQKSKGVINNFIKSLSETEASEKQENTRAPKAVGRRPR